MHLNEKLTVWNLFEIILNEPTCGTRTKWEKIIEKRDWLFFFPQLIDICVCFPCYFSPLKMHIKLKFRRFLFLDSAISVLPNVFDGRVRTCMNGSEIRLQNDLIYAFCWSFWIANFIRFNKLTYPDVFTSKCGFIEF